MFKNILKGQWHTSTKCWRVKWKQKTTVKSQEKSQQTTKLIHC